MRELLERWKWYIAVMICFFIFFSAKSCINKHVNELRGKNELLEEQNKKLQDGVKVMEVNRLILRDSIKKETDKRQKERELLEKKVADSNARIKELEKSNNSAKKEIRNLSLEDVATKLNSTYGGNNALASTNSIDIKGELPHQILETVSDLNTITEISKEKDNQLDSKNKVINSLNLDKKALSLNLNSAEKSIEGLKTANELQEDFNKSLKKENKSLRLERTFNRILVPAAAVLGIFIGVEIQK